MSAQTYSKYWWLFDSLWIKFCGVADEYDMLHDKWTFLRSGDSLTALRPIEGTFKRLFSLSEECRRLFEQLGFHRLKAESVQDLEAATGGVTPDYIFSRYVQIKWRIEELSKYLEILRITFNQRTVSDDVSQTIAGFPHSPERTAGSELVCLGADNVAQAYYRCLNFANLEWDGVISFIYPLEEPPCLHGGFMWAAYLSGQFHISLCGESKYFPGAFLPLAHEMGHASIAKVGKSDDDVTRWRDRRSWFKALHLYFASFMERENESFEKTHPKCSYCQYCLRQRIDILSHDFEASRGFFEECVADLIGVEIGGPSLAWSLSDLSPSQEVLFRLGFLVGYYLEDEEFYQVLHVEMQSLANKVAEELSSRCAFPQQAKACVESFYVIAAGAGLDFNKVQNSFGEIVGHEIPDLYKECVDEFEELGISFIPGKSILSCVIIPECRFGSSYSEKSRIEKSLECGIPVFGEDPRRILDAYYALYRRQGIPPSFSTTVNSLAFNKAPGVLADPS